MNNKKLTTKKVYIYINFFIYIKTVDVRNSRCQKYFDTTRNKAETKEKINPIILYNLLSLYFPP